MKQIMIAILILFLWPSLIFSDVLPPDSHFVDRHVLITNLNEFPELRLIGYVTGPMIERYEVSSVKENVPLSKGYKFNEFKLFAITTAILNSAGGLENIDFEEIAKILAPAEIIDPDGTYVTNDNPLESEYYYYNITEVIETTLTLKLLQRVLKYNDGTPDRIITY